MNIKKSRFLNALSVSMSSFVFACIQFYSTRNETFPLVLLPWALILLSIVLFFVSYRRSSEYYVKETPDGIMLEGAKTGLYDPDFVEYSRIAGAAMKKNRIVINYNESDSKIHYSSVEIYVPKKYRNELLDELKEKALANAV
ncbi:MAG: hypothetical protein K5930_10735 [Treponemataceae bacterium]|nr:hypothetical protein [Treponemataceae bacterium]